MRRSALFDGTLPMLADVAAGLDEIAVTAPACAAAAAWPKLNE